MGLVGFLVAIGLGFRVVVVSGAPVVVVCFISACSDGLFDSTGFETVWNVLSIIGNSVVDTAAVVSLFGSLLVTSVTAVVSLTVSSPSLLSKVVIIDSVFDSTVSALCVVASFSLSVVVVSLVKRESGILLTLLCTLSSV